MCTCAWRTYSAAARSTLRRWSPWLLLDTPDLVQFANLALSAGTTPSTGVHVAFAARSRDEVDAFHAAAIAAGGTDNGAYGPRDYGPYAAYVLDPDGTNLEAAFRS